MRNFIIFFKGNEGTSPLVRLLDNFESVSVLHQIDSAGWEPFDLHNCGPMSLRDLERCLDMVFDEQPLDLARLNDVYMKTATRPLASFDKSVSVGFKMRFQPVSTPSRALAAASRRVGVAADFIETQRLRPYKRAMFRVLRRHSVIVFLAVRQDVFRWALSLYHGDGEGGKGHLQFKLADGQISREDIPTIRVDCERFDAVITDCERQHASKRALAAELAAAGVEVHPLRYEDFLADPVQYFQHLAAALDLDVSPSDVDAALAAGSHLQKVHSDDISEFVENHEEVMNRFGQRFEAW